KLLDAGFAPGSEFLWDYHYRVYWDLTQRIYREALDPSFDGDLDAGVPFCRSGTPNCDADYDYADRPRAQAAVKRIALTGRIGKPMITLDRKSTRLNSSHVKISYAVFCLKKKSKNMLQ